MPIHDWTRVRANRFHDFHQTWIGTIRDALNAGSLPPGYFAMREQITGGPEPDVIALELDPRPSPGDHAAGGAALQTAPPKTRFVTRTEAGSYARKADRLTIRHPDGKLVAVIEIVSPGNKDSRHAIESFVRKAVSCLEAGIHLLIVDLFPPNPRNPQGIHKAIWEQFKDEPFELPPDKPLTLAAYSAGADTVAYVEPVAVGDELPEMPLYLSEGGYIFCPLESTYAAAWEVFPAVLKGPLESPRTPGPG